MNEMTNTHILVNRFAYAEPATLEEAVDLLAQYGPRARILAGGTDLFVHMKIERSAPEMVISIAKIPGLERIETNDQRLMIGARASIMSLEQDPRVQAYFPAFAEACASFSTTQIQLMGTVGGNLGNGSPASDSAPALIAHGAAIELTSPQFIRTLPLEQFFIGPGKTVLQPGELITRVVLPQPAAYTGSAFLKITRVAADIAKASAAVVLIRDPYNRQRVAECRLAFGSVAPTPMRARAAEALLAGQVFSEQLAEEVAQAAAAEIMPIDDVRSQAWYRREAVRAMTYDALILAWQRSSEAVSAPWQLSTALTPQQPALPSIPPMQAGEKRMIELEINGVTRQVWVAAHDLLLNVLRENLQLTGTKYGCGIGECSACTVLLDGKPALACLVLAVSAVGKSIRTIEGLEQPDGELDPVQDAFIEYAAYQCGYCTPGMILTAKSLLTVNPSPSENDVRHYLRGNICRCTGYANIVRAVLSVAE